MVLRENGSDSHLTFEWIKRVAGISMLHVPFVGTAPAMIAFERDDVHLLSLTPGNGPLLEKIRDKKATALLVEGDTRISLLPDTPSYKEAGLPPYRMRSWFAFFAPKNTPKEIVNSLSAKISDIVKDPKFQEQYLVPNGLAGVGGSPAELHKLAADTGVYAAELVAMAGVQADR
jgi:tripartite-type tricarboxylate transporter receptor subunit TctC